VWLIVIPVYGVQVCPYIESLQAWQVAVPVALALGLQFGLRGPLLRAVVSAQPLENRVTRAFWLELSLFMATAVGLTLYNAVVYDFPLESGLKVMVGIAGLGFFAAVDLSLSEEMRVADAVEAGTGHIAQGAQPFYKIGRGAGRERGEGPGVE